MSTTKPTNSAAPYSGPALGPGHAGHPSDLQYIGIALVLGALTAIEVGLYYVKSLSSTANAILLLALAAIKFFVVAAFFMHLKFETRLFKRLFVGGGILAGFCYIGVLSAFGVFSNAKKTWPIFIGAAIVLGAIAMMRNRAESTDQHDHAGHDHDHDHDHADDHADHDDADRSAAGSTH